MGLQNKGRMRFVSVPSCSSLTADCWMGRAGERHQKKKNAELKMRDKSDESEHERDVVF